MKVQEVMTSNVKSCLPETNLAAAAAIMWENDRGALPVVDEAGKVLGMITDRDICIAVATRGRLASEIMVSEVISGRVYTCAQEDDIKDALQTMRQEKVRRLPVIDSDGRFQGILSTDDIVLSAEESQGKRIPDLSYEDAISTLKAIGEPRRLHRAAGI